MAPYRIDIEHQIIPEAVVFFAVFSRFEFALKRGGFLMGAPGNSAHADWNTLATTLGPAFFATLHATPEASIFFTAQPKRLVVVDQDNVTFEEPDDIVNLQMLFEAVRLVRNNLFHGEKAYIGQRDKDLLAASLFVLDSTMAACETTPACARVPIAFAFAPIGGH